MNIKGTLYEVVKSGDTYYSNVSGYLKEATAEELSAIMALKAIAKKATTIEDCAETVNAYAAANREIFVKRPVKDIHNILNGQGVEKVMAKQTDDWAADWDGTAPMVMVVKEVAEETKVEVKPEEPEFEGKKIKRKDYNAIQKVIEHFENFFTEFKFGPSNRMVDTFFRTAMEDKKEYCLNYFKLTDNMNLEIIAEKLKSDEFDMICNESEELKATYERVADKVNNRLKITFGPAGTGKTTEAIKAIEGTDCDIVACSEDMYPSELQKEFAFHDESGKPMYRPAPLLRAAMEGKKIVFDEFGLLPVGSQRFLQGFLDGKKEVTTYFGKIKIKEGFEVIATMNLYEGGTTYRVVEPLVDRAYEIKELILDAEKITKNLLCDAEIV